MAELQNLFSQGASLFTNLIANPDWHNVLDVLIVTVVIYQIIKMLSRTRANSVMKGVGVVLALTWLCEVLQLNAMNWLLLQMINTGAVLLVVLFQPELRRGLEQIGRSRWRSLFPGNVGREQRQIDTMIKELVTATTNLARRRVGALVVFERDTGLMDVIKSGTVLDAFISAPLIENVFEPNTPLHDGAMVIRGERIVAAACILQLSDDLSISRELGTRHRAALGISETTDAVALIVSEESGIISCARGGKLTRYLDAKTLTTILSELYSAQAEPLFPAFFRRKEARDEN